MLLTIFGVLQTYMSGVDCWKSRVKNNVKNGELPPVSKKQYYFACSVSVSLLASCLGCGGGPAAVLPPHIDPDSAAELAMETYDADGNGLVEAEELEQAPGLNAAMATLDTNKDGKVAEDEIADRVRAWRGTGVGMTTIQCSVTLDGRPLGGADITFEPEEFLGEEIQPAVAVSGPLGNFYPLIPKEKLPSPTSPVGIQLGLYKIKISRIVNGEEKIPAKYNKDTILGQEVSNDDPAIQRHSVVYRLESN